MVENTNVKVKSEYMFYKNGKLTARLIATKEEAREYIRILQTESGAIWNARLVEDKTKYKDNYDNTKSSLSILGRKVG